MSGGPLSLPESTCTITHAGTVVIQNLHRSKTELRRSKDDGDPSRPR